MAVILNFRQARKRRRKTESAVTNSAQTDQDASGASGEVVIFPGIRVDYGAVEVALSHETTPSKKQHPEHTGPSGRRSRKRRKA
ncbi:MAG: hypothetical protein AAGD23_10935 [Pseudomonadota bacterium]